MALPDFLCIGAQKAGTSWLSNQLRHHPRVWVPPFKELHYFDWQRPWSPHDYRKAVRYRFATHIERRRLRSLPSRVSAAIRAGRTWEVAWYLRYYLGLPGDRWYAGLFPPRENGVSRGELTPDYSVLSEDRVRVVRDLMPDLKILLILRDPVERAWSQARMFLGKHAGKDVSKLSDSSLIEFLNSRSVRLRSTYTAILDAWMSVFPPEQLLLIWNEEIRTDPAAVMGEVSDFLGVEHAHAAISVSLRDRVHVGHAVRMPAAVARHLAASYQDELDELDRRFGGYATEWRTRAKKILEETAP